MVGMMLSSCKYCTGIISFYQDYKLADISGYSCFYAKLLKNRKLSAKA